MKQGDVVDLVKLNMQVNEINNVPLVFPLFGGGDPPPPPYPGTIADLSGPRADFSLNNYSWGLETIIAGHGSLDLYNKGQLIGSYPYTTGMNGVTDPRVQDKVTLPR